MFSDLKSLNSFCWIRPVMISQIKNTMLPEVAACPVFQHQSRSLCYPSAIWLFLISFYLLGCEKDEMQTAGQEFKKSSSVSWGHIQTGVNMKALVVLVFFGAACKKQQFLWHICVLTTTGIAQCWLISVFIWINANKLILCQLLQRRMRRLSGGYECPRNSVPYQVSERWIPLLW